MSWRTTGAVDIQALVDQVDEAGVYERLTQLAVKRHHTGNPSGLEQVRGYADGPVRTVRTPVEQQPAFFQTYSYPNILARRGDGCMRIPPISLDAHCEWSHPGTGC